LQLSFAPRGARIVLAEVMSDYGDSSCRFAAHQCGKACLTGLMLPNHLRLRLGLSYLPYTEY
jgi:hypothetical protein